MDEIGKVWEIKDVGGTEYFLGMRVQQYLNLGTICFTQRPYWEYVISQFGLDHITPRNTPLPAGIQLDSSMSPKTDSERKEMKGKPYRPILGMVMWGQLDTCPDLSFTVSLLARFQSNPGMEHWNALMHVIDTSRTPLTSDSHIHVTTNSHPMPSLTQTTAGVRIPTVQPQDMYS